MNRVPTDLDTAIHYLTLGFILLAALIGLVTLRYHPLRPLVIMLTAVAYVLWGIIHHLILGTLHRKVVLEYLGLAVLGAIIISTLL